MKAIVFTRYGSPDVLEQIDIDKPAPQDNELLVKIKAVSVNPLDWHRMRGAPFLVRFSDGLLKPKNPMIGADIAGTVEAVGKSVTQFKLGDDVYGDIGAGGLAEFVCVSENHMVQKPANQSFAEAAAVPVAALTALQGLRNSGQVQAGQQVLINGASGGVGTYAVQIAKALGVMVTAVCSTRNVELVRSLGADHIVDYTREDVTKNGKQYDLILDNVGNFSVSNYKRSLKPNGIAVVVGFTTLMRMLQVVLFGSLETKFGSKKIGPMLAQINQEDLQFINGLIETGQVKSVIDRCYPFNEAAEAVRYLEEGHARGKVIVSVDDN
ncbi:MAG: NAD(P)-dependent alcohol dehydrogenase [Chloroflexi bacterium]|nr:MAG: NAD(P)-dependent alcohol dehydrogenase [Chloroflexota bacterium]